MLHAKRHTAQFVTQVGVMFDANEAILLLSLLKTFQTR